MIGIFKNGGFRTTQLSAVCVYKRYSTQMQRPASLEDQLRSCQELAGKLGWEILPEHHYQDAGKSGTTRVGRDGLEALMKTVTVRPCPFDYVFVDDTSRLARDGADLQQMVKEFTFYGVKLCFVSQQLDSSDVSFDLLVGLNAVVDQQFVARIRAKVFSGQKDRVLNGFHVDRCSATQVVPIASPLAGSKGHRTNSRLASLVSSYAALTGSSPSRNARECSFP